MTSTLTTHNHHPCLQGGGPVRLLGTHQSEIDEIGCVSYHADETAGGSCGLYYIYIMYIEKMKTTCSHLPSDIQT